MRATSRNGPLALITFSTARRRSLEPSTLNGNGRQTISGSAHSADEHELELLLHRRLTRASRWSVRHRDLDRVERLAPVAVDHRVGDLDQRGELAQREEARLEAQPQRAAAQRHEQREGARRSTPAARRDGARHERPRRSSRSRRPPAARSRGRGAGVLADAGAAEREQDPGGRGRGQQQAAAVPLAPNGPSRITAASANATSSAADGDEQVVEHLLDDVQPVDPHWTVHSASLLPARPSARSGPRRRAARLQQVRARRPSPGARSPTAARACVAAALHVDAAPAQERLVEHGVEAGVERPSSPRRPSPPRAGPRRPALASARPPRVRVRARPSPPTHASTRPKWTGRRSASSTQHSWNAWPVPVVVRRACPARAGSRRGWRARR